jgi:hypothetical protein
MELQFALVTANIALFYMKRQSKRMTEKKNHPLDRLFAPRHPG